MVRIAIIIGSTRPGRNGEQVGQWVYNHARQRHDAEFELIDLKEVDLPFLDEAIPPSVGRYANAHTKAWAQRIASFDGFVFVTAEYNHGMPGALKNAIDFLFKEWNDKAAGFVSYGSAGGVRAVEQLRQVMGEIAVADVRRQVFLPLGTEFEEMRRFKPNPSKVKDLEEMLNQVVAWSTALKTLRA